MEITDSANEKRFNNEKEDKIILPSLLDLKQYERSMKIPNAGAM